MSFSLIRRDGLAFWRSDLLDVPHCFSTRVGGVSSGCCASLNLFPRCGDSAENVLENYRRLGAAVGFRAEHTVLTKQVHADRVERVGRAERGEGLFSPVPRARDGLITDEPETALVCFSADCVPILLYDPHRRAAAAVHAGWRGTAQDIVGKAVRRMTEEFGSDPQELAAAIGPCIGSCCFETRGDVPDAMRLQLGAEAERAIRRKNEEKYLVDLKLLNALLLRRAGTERIDICPACTVCEPELYWSFRRDGAARGTLAAVISL